MSYLFLLAATGCALHCHLRLLTNNLGCVSPDIQFVCLFLAGEIFFHSRQNVVRHVCQRSSLDRTFSRSGTQKVSHDTLAPSPCRVKHPGLLSNIGNGGTFGAILQDISFLTKGFVNVLHIFCDFIAIWRRMVLRLDIHVGLPV